MSEEELEEQIVEQIKVLTEELGGTLKQLTRANSTGRMCKVIEIEYNIINQWVILYGLKNTDPKRLKSVFYHKVSRIPFCSF